MPPKACCHIQQLFEIIVVSVHFAGITKKATSPRKSDVQALANLFQISPELKVTKECFANRAPRQHLLIIQQSLPKDGPPSPAAQLTHPPWEDRRLGLERQPLPGPVVPAGLRATLHSTFLQQAHRLLCTPAPCEGVTSLSLTPENSRTVNTAVWIPGDPVQQPVMRIPHSHLCSLLQARPQSS